MSDIKIELLNRADPFSSTWAQRVKKDESQKGLQFGQDLEDFMLV